MAHSPLRPESDRRSHQPLVVESTTVSEGGRFKHDSAPPAAPMGKRASAEARRRAKHDRDVKKEPNMLPVRPDAPNGIASAAPLPVPANAVHAPRAENGVTRATSPKKVLDRKRGRDDDGHCDSALATSSLSLNELDDYRNECIKLEKLRHARVYEADKRRLYHENVILTMYQMEVDAILDEFEQGKRAAMLKMLSDNAEKIRQVEELRCGICKDDMVGGWQRKHEMALRGRGVVDEEVDDGRPARRKRTRSNSVKVNVELDDHQVSDDLAEMRGEKRQREEGNERERRSKKRK